MRLRLSVIVATLLSASLGAHADTVALSFTGGTPASSGQTRGFEFTTSSAVTVTALGWWDDAGDGLTDSHEVGIWNSGGTLLVSGTVASGTTDTLEDGFRFDSGITGTTLLAPGTYIIGGLSTDDDAVGIDVSPSDLLLGTGITFLTNETNGTGGFSFPTGPQSGLDDGAFGPSFTYVSSVPNVPEPSSLVLLGTGLFGAFGAARRRFTA